MDRVPRPDRSSTRRQRVREATAREIKSTARRLLVERGAEGLTLRAIARDMGMTAPALYRYFPSREDMLEHVIAELYDEVTGALEAARDELPDEDVVGRMLAVSRTFRRWALDHPGEFGLLFGSPIAGTSASHPGGSGDARDPRDPRDSRDPGDPGDPGDRDGGPAHAAGRRFGMLFGVLVGLLYQRQPFPIRSDEEIEPVLAARLREWCDDFPVRLPLGVLQVFLSCWIRLYGAVCLEVFGHLRFAVEDAEPMFETELQSLAGLLGARYRPPVAAAAHGAA
jgi:AcrR family transcriptional regulator